MKRRNVRFREGVELTVDRRREEIGRHCNVEVPPGARSRKPEVGLSVTPTFHGDLLMVIPVGCLHGPVPGLCGVVVDEHRAVVPPTHGREAGVVLLGRLVHHHLSWLHVDLSQNPGVGCTLPRASMGIRLEQD